MVGSGICGCGNFVEQGVLPFLTEVEYVKVTAAHSYRAQWAQHIAQNFAIPHVFDDYVALVGPQEIDAVNIFFPNNYHRDQTITAANAGKYVLCEKPMGLDAAECQETVDASSDNQIKRAIGFCYRGETPSRRYERLFMRDA